jgi:hypothetical protein
MDPLHLFGTQFGMGFIQLHAGHIHVLDHLLVMALGTPSGDTLETIHGLEIHGTDIGGALITHAPPLTLQQLLHGVFR